MSKIFILFVLLAKNIFSQINFTEDWNISNEEGELSYFSVNQDDNSIIISWEMLIEKKTDCYLIERSNSNFDIWKTLDTISRVGKRDSVKKYFYRDTNICNEIYFYRLVMLNNNNTYKDFGIKTINSLKDCSYKIDIYSNPVLDKSTIKITVSDNDDYYLLITNSIGNILFLKEFRIVNNEFLFDLEISNLNSLKKGIYFYSLFNSKEKLITKKVFHL